MQVYTKEKLRNRAHCEGCGILIENRLRRYCRPCTAYRYAWQHLNAVRDLLRQASQ